MRSEINRDVRESGTAYLWITHRIYTLQGGIGIFAGFP